MNFRLLSIVVMSLVAVLTLTSCVKAQECLDCNAFQLASSSFIQPTSVKRFQVTEMVKTIKMVPTEIEVPMTRTYETTTTTREIYDGGMEKMVRGRRERRVRGFNWGCVATAVGAYFDCSMAKRGERKGLLRRLLFFRR